MSNLTKTYLSPIRLLILFLLLSVNAVLIAQSDEIDSLELWIKEHPKEDTIKGQVLARLSYLYNNVNNQKGLQVGKQALAIGERLNNAAVLARAHNSIGINHYIAGYYDSAIYSYEKAIQYKLAIEDEAGAAATRVNLGVIYWRQDKYAKAIVVLNEALDYFLSSNEQAYQVAAYTNLGLIYLDIDDFEASIDAFQNAVDIGLPINIDPSKAYRNLGRAYNRENDHEKAILYGKKAAEAALLNKNDSWRIDAYLDLLNPYMDLKQYDSALYYGELALRLAIETNNKVKEARAYSRLAYLYNRRSSFSSAIQSHQKAIRTLESLKNSSGLRGNYLGMGRSQLRLGDTANALVNLKKAFAMAEEDSVYSTLQSASKELANYYRKQGDFEKAYNYHLKYELAKDSIDNLEKFKEVSRIQARFERDRLVQELATQQIENELRLHEEIDRQRLFNYVSISVVTIALILLAMGYRVYQLKNRSAQRLEEKNKLILDQKNELAFKSDKLQIINSQLKSLAEFRTDLTRMIAHDMKNPLNAIIGLSNSLHDKKVKAITQSGYELLNLVTNMLAVDKFQSTNYQPNLAIWPLDQIILEAKRDVEILLEAKSIRFESFIPKMICVKVDKEAIKRVMVNLFSNAIKYSPNAGKITVDKIKVEDGNIYLKVTDQGAGISKERLPRVFDKFWQSDAKESGFAASTGLGLTFCKMTVEAHGGEIWAESEIGKGTTIYFALPLEVENTCEKTLAQLFEEGLNPEQDVVSLIEEGEHEQIAEHVEFLRGLKVHQVSAITRVIKDLERQEIKSQWKSHLQTAVYQADQQRYDDLLQMLEKDYPTP